MLKVFQSYINNIGLCRKRRRGAADYPESQSSSIPSQDLFSRLPNELIGLVATFLPKSAAACLALTSKRMLYVPGISDLSDELSLFLSYLEKDLARYRLCILPKVAHRDWQ